MNVKNPEAVLFDYGGTLAVSDVCRLEKGIAKILEISEHPDGARTDSILKLIDELYEETGPLNREHSVEFRFDSLYRYAFEYYHVKFDVSDDRIENLFRDAIYDYRPTEGIADLLQYLYRAGIRTAVVSNMEFSGEALKREIDRILPQNHFEFVIASSDYCFRKPSSRIFDLAKKKLSARSDIWYAGDSLECDVRGAARAGMIPVWYNPGREKAEIPAECIDIAGWRGLIAGLEEGRTRRDPIR